MVAASHLGSSTEFLPARTTRADGGFILDLEDGSLLSRMGEGDYYLLGNTYLACLGDEAYFLLMDKPTAIYRVAQGSQVIEKLAPFPGITRSGPS
jgi:hypothetical protein